MTSEREKMGLVTFFFFINLEMLVSKTYFLLNGMKILSVVFDYVLLRKF